MAEITGRLTASEYLEKALAWSNRVRDETNCVLDVSYGNDERQKLDIYLPEVSSPENPSSAAAPVLIFVHGGYWVAGHKDILGFMAPPITTAPAILVAAGYRLAPGAKYPEQVDDCRNALRWVYENISQYGGDPDRIFIGGHSAGGHLASLVTLQRSRLPEFQLPPDIVKGCFPVSGVFDVSDSPRERQEALLSDLSQARDASPIYNTAGNSVPFFLEIGGDDFPDLRHQHPEMVKALKSEPGRVEEMERLGHNHFEISLDHGSIGNPWSRKVVEWLMLQVPLGR